jgi:HK97 family phage portal protein
MDGLIEHRATIASSGVAVTNRTVAGLPAFDAGVAIAANAVAQLTGKVWRGDGPVRQQVTTTWQARLFRGSPNAEQSWFTFWYIIEAARTARRRGYIWKTKDATGRVVAMTALHPDQVWPFATVGSDRKFAVTFTPNYPKPPEVDGFGSVTVGLDQITYIPGRGGCGEIFPRTPVDEFRASLGLAVAKQEHEAAVYKNGAQGGVVVRFPTGVNKKQADEWRDDFDAEHAGAGNSAKTKVVGSGAEISQIGMTQKDTQFIESVGMSLLDCALILDIPPWLLGVPENKSKPQSPEHEMQRWVYFHLAPRLTAIESAINADTDLFGSGIDTFGFDTANIIRGDLATEADIAIRKVQAGIWLPDEARSRDSLPELPDGVGRIPQITPVGGAPNAAPTTAPVEDDEE